jgi:hypothetical protein
LKTNNLHNKRAVWATLTGLAAIAVAANTKAQGFRRPKKTTASIDFYPLLAMCLGTHQIGGAVSDDWFRRRDADGCGRDDRAPEEIVNDSGDLVCEQI